MFENKELVFGKLDPGKSKTAIAPLGWCDVEGHKFGSTAVLPKDAPRVCKLPKNALTRADGIKLLGIDRDMPNLDRHCTYEQSLKYLTRHCDFIPEREMELIVGKNLLRIFGIGEQPH